MRPQCRQAVNQAAGRELSDAEIKKIEDRLSATMRELARTDPTWKSKSPDQRVIEASQQAMADIRHEADLKIQRAQLQIIKTAAMENRIGDLMTAYDTGRSKALVKEMELTSSYAEGIKRETLSNLMDLLDAVDSRQGAGVGRRAMMFLFDAENPAMSRDLATEIFNNANGGTGNSLAQKGAKAWLDSIENLRQRFNATGGDVGKLDYGYLPQPHDQARVRGSGEIGARDEWAQKTMPLLDRSRYLTEDGSRMSDAQVIDFLNASWETIATGGLNKSEPGQFKGSGAKANAGSESRQIHFKDADAYLQYMGEYGGGSMYDSMLGHIGGLSRDIALVERYGPNPSQQMRVQFDVAAKADNGLKRSFGLTTQSYWDLVSGKTGLADNGTIAQVAQTVRNVQTFGKLASAVLSSVTDMGTYFVTTGFNNLSYWEAFKNIGKQLDGETRDFLTMHGVIADSMTSDLNRWSADNIKNDWSGRLANSTMKLSLMNAWTDTLRRAFSMTMMNGLAKLSRTDWAALSEWDRSHLTRKGISEADWNVITQANLTPYNGAEFLTPESIHAIGDLEQVRGADFQRIKDEIAGQTKELTARNTQEQGWINGRIDKFDAARDSLNKAVKDLLARKLKQNEKATGPLLERMALLEAQREAAKVQADMEADFNKLFTQADIESFTKGLRSAEKELSSANKSALSSAEKSGRDFGIRKQRLESQMRDAQKKAASGSESQAEKQVQKMALQQFELERAKLQNEIEIAFKATPDAERAAFRSAVNDVSDIRQSANAGIRSAESIGRRYGEQKGALDRRMKEIEARIAGMDAEAKSAANKAGKEALAKAEEMRGELQDFIKRSQERQARRQAVIDRIQAQEAPRLAAESQRIKNEVVAKVIGLITDESEYAVLNPDLATKSIAAGGSLQRGTVRGELARSVMQFKSFPIAMISRHWRRMFEAPRGLEGAPTQANRLAYGMGLGVTLGILGAVALQSKQVVQGKDPIDMTRGKFWLQAMAQGGGLGIVGDFLLTDPSANPGDATANAIKNVAGPTVGSAFDVGYKLGVENIYEAAQGKDTHFGAEAIRTARSHLPFVNIWYAKAAVDHMGLHALQENLSPGYLSRMQQRARKDWNQEYWWKPGTGAPERAPDLTAAGGR